MGSNMIKLTVIAITLLALIVGGCSKYGPIINICQSETGEIIAFSTHRHEEVWVVTANSFEKCGRVPFALSASGSLLAATSVQEPQVVIITNLQGTPREVTELDLRKAYITDGWIVQSLTFLEGQGIVVVVRSPAGAVNSVAVPLPKDLLPHIVGAGECLAIDASYSDSDSGGFLCRYRSRSGLTVVEARPSNRPATVSRLSPDGTTCILLEESSTEYIRRSLAMSGFQYP